MSASTSDKFQKLGGTSSLVNTPKVTSVRSSGGTTLSVDNCNWDQTTGKIFATYQVDTSGAVVSGTETIWTGVVTSTTAIGSLSRLAGAADSGNAIGDYVELLPASLWANKLIDGLLTEHTNPNGYHALTSNSTITAAKFITSLNDTNGNELIRVGATSSAVNDYTVTNAATGNAPTLTATGDDSNIYASISGKGNAGVLTQMPQQSNVTNSYPNGLLTQYGWGFWPGTGATTATKTITFPVAYTSTPYVFVSLVGFISGSDPTGPGGGTGGQAGGTASADTVTATTFKADYIQSATFASTIRIVFTWWAIGVK